MPGGPPDILSALTRPNINFGRIITGECHRFSPSHISIDTIYKSQGMISEVFLRKAGVSDDFITYMRSLVTKPIKFAELMQTRATGDVTGASANTGCRAA